MTSEAYVLDEIDRALIGALRSGGRIGNTQLANEVGLARGTVQSRLARLEQRGVIVAWGPELNAAATAYNVTAFVTLSIAQGAHDKVVAGLTGIPEVIEVHVVTGGGDLLCRVVATSNDHLHELVQRIVAIAGVLRSESQLALHTSVQRSLADLIGQSR